MTALTALTALLVPHMARFRFYGRERWTRVRAAKLTATPLCEHWPADRRRAATSVGHKRPVTDKADLGAWE